MTTDKLWKIIVELTDETPIDMFGEDWEEYAEEYIEDHNEEIYANKFGI